MSIIHRYTYELQLQHTFTVATYSRTTTPDVQVELEYDGIIGYGEASMPPYLGQSVESVTDFLRVFMMVLLYFLLTVLLDPPGNRMILESTPVTFST